MVAFVVILIVLELILISETDAFFATTSRYTSLNKNKKNIESINKNQHKYADAKHYDYRNYVPFDRHTSLASSVDFKSNSDSNKPKANPEKLSAEQSLSQGTIQQGGYFCSFEMYACQRETQKLVGSHLANWARAEIYCLKEAGTFSMILNSVCGRRVVHVVGWKVEGNVLARTFEDMKKRGEGSYCT